MPLWTRRRVFDTYAPMQQFVAERVGAGEVPRLSGRFTLGDLLRNGQLRQTAAVCPIASRAITIIGRLALQKSEPLGDTPNRAKNIGS